MPETNFQDRIKEFRRLKSDEITAHPTNWRIHGLEQKNALNYLLNKIGISGVITVYEDPEWGFTLIDGHMRHEEINQEVPAVILDVTREEAQMLLLSMDAIAGMAESDTSNLKSLIQSTYEPDGEYLTMIKNMHGAIAAYEEEMATMVDDGIPSVPTVKEPPKYPLAAELNEKYDYVVILCETDREFAALTTKLGIERQQDYKSSATGLGRVVRYRNVENNIRESR